MELAENKQRFNNYLIDSIICSILTLILFALAVIFIDFSDKDEIFFTWYIYFYLALRTIYYTVFEYYFYRTIGKTITKTKVLTIDGERPGFATVLGRSFGRLIPFNAVSFLANGNWHDSVSKTMVVKEVL